MSAYDFSDLIDKIMSDLAISLMVPPALLHESPPCRSLAGIVSPRFPKQVLTRSEKIAEAWRQYRMSQPTLLLAVEDGPWCLPIGEPEEVSPFAVFFEEADFHVVRYGDITVVEADGVIVERLTTTL